MPQLKDVNKLVNTSTGTVDNRLLLLHTSSEHIKIGCRLHQTLSNAESSMQIETHSPSARFDFFGAANLRCATFSRNMAYERLHHIETYLLSPTSFIPSIC
jgi:hypothetical protein